MFQAAVFFVVLYCVASSDHPDEVKSLPGLNFTLNYRHYSGYLNATDGKFLHYWFVESQRSPSTDPVLLWLNGGPGCSSLEGFLNELGPLQILPDGKTLINNTYSWNREANIIFLESPAGVGFSYSVKKKYSTDDNIVSYDNYVALLNFFAKFPQFKKNDFYVAGESYGGVYVPTLSLRVLNGTDKINLKAAKFLLAGTRPGHLFYFLPDYMDFSIITFDFFFGFVIGNGYLDFEDNYNSLMFFARYHGLIGASLWKKLEKNCCNGTASQESCKFAFPSSWWCRAYVLITVNLIHKSGLNAYNLYADCAHSSQENSRYLVDKRNMLAFSPTSMKASKFGEVICIDSSGIHQYLNQPEVRKALHIPSFVQEWDMCSPEVSKNYKMLYSTVRPEILKLIHSGKLRGLIYNGDVDMVCNFLGDEWFCDKLGLKVTDSYSQWWYNDQVAGFAKQYEKLTFMTVKGSGHMVPQDKPGPAFKMITSFLNGEL